MKKIFKDWTRFEQILLLGSLITIITAGIFCKSNILTIVCSVTGIFVALTQAKGKVISQFIGLILVVLYSILSYQNKYYGEVLIYIFIMFPLFISGIISWIKNIDKETNTVIENKLNKKEWIILILISVILFIGLYNLLKYFNTSQLFVSTLSMVMSLFATYLVVRRSKYGFLFYICNDIILFILWGIPVISGNVLLMPMLFNPIINFVNDCYAWKSWNERESDFDERNI